MEIDPRTSALLVIDMQNDFVHPKGKFPSFVQGEEGGHLYLVAPIKSLIDRAHEVEMPVIYTGGVHRPDFAEDAEDLNSKKFGALVKGTWGAQILDELKPVERDFMIEKQRYSAFYATNLDMILRRLGVKSLVIVGVASRGCVEATAWFAVHYDYRVNILEDCIGPRLTSTKEMKFFHSRGMFKTSGEVLTALEAVGSKPQTA